MTYGIRKRVEDDHRLFVTSGGQRGASVSLGDEVLTLGAAPDCDILLLADEVGDATATLTPDADGFLEVSGQLVQIGGRRLKPGATERLGCHVPMKLGRAHLMIAGSLDEADRVRKQRERRATQLGWAASIAVAVCATGAVALTGGVGMKTADGAAQRMSPQRPAAESFLPLLASNDLQARLAENGLASLIVSPNRDAGTVVVQGGLRPSERNRWDDVRKWFDATYGASVQLEARLSADSDAVTLPFAVHSIWMLPYPRVTLHDGSQSRIGDMLPGGWHLDAIGENVVEISRNGERLALSL